MTTVEATGSADALTADGGIVTIRPVRPSDRHALSALYATATPDDRYLCFFASPGADALAAEVERLCRPATDRHLVVLAVEGANLVGVASRDHSDEIGQAEFALYVAATQRGRGIGTLLLEHLAARAHWSNIAELVGEVLPGNTRMLSVTRDLSAHAWSRYNDGIVDIGLGVGTDEATQVAVDGRDRIAERASLHALLSPTSVAAVGAGRRPGGIGRETLPAGAPVEFFFAYEWPTWAPATNTLPVVSVWPDGETDRAIKGMLNESVAAAKQTHPGVPTHVSIENNSAALTLIGRSDEAGLIVLGSRGHSSVVGLFGSVGVAVTAHAHCPVIVVRGDASPSAAIVVGIDESPSAPTLLAFAVEQAATRGVPLRVIRAWTPITGIWEESPIATGSITQQERQPFDDLVAAWRDKHPEVDISAEAVVGHPAGVLAEASTTAQLLVVGTRGRGALRGMMLGSVSQHLLRQSACTVAVVHEPAKA